MEVEFKPVYNENFTTKQLPDTEVDNDVKNYTNDDKRTYYFL